MNDPPETCRILIASQFLSVTVGFNFIPKNCSKVLTGHVMAEPYF